MLSCSKLPAPALGCCSGTRTSRGQVSGPGWGLEGSGLWGACSAGAPGRSQIPGLPAEGWKSVRATAAATGAARGRPWRPSLTLSHSHRVQPQSTAWGTQGESVRVPSPWQRSEPPRGEEFCVLEGG